MIHRLCQVALVALVATQAVADFGPKECLYLFGLQTELATVKGISDLGDPSHGISPDQYAHDICRGQRDVEDYKACLTHAEEVKKAAAFAYSFVNGQTSASDAKSGVDIGVAKCLESTRSKDISKLSSKENQETSLCVLSLPCFEGHAVHNLASNETVSDLVAAANILTEEAQRQKGAGLRSQTVRAHRRMEKAGGGQGNTNKPVHDRPDGVPVEEVALGQNVGKTGPGARTWVPNADVDQVRPPETWPRGEQGWDAAKNAADDALKEMAKQGVPSETKQQMENPRGDRLPEGQRGKDLTPIFCSGKGKDSGLDDYDDGDKGLWGKMKEIFDDLCPDHNKDGKLIPLLYKDH